MAEEDIPSNEPVRLLSSQSLNLLAELVRHAGTPELVNELIVIDTCVLLSLDEERCDLITVVNGGLLSGHGGVCWLLLVSSSTLHCITYA